MHLRISFGFMVKMVNNCYLRRQIVLYVIFLLFETQGHTKCHKVHIQCRMVSSVAHPNPPGSLARKATILSKPLASLKFPPITSISSSSTRSKDWDDVLTAHAEEMCVRSWTVLNKRIGKHTFNSAESSKWKSPSGVVKVPRLPSSFSPTSHALCSVFVLPLVEILVLRALQLERFTCGTCNPG